MLLQNQEVWGGIEGITFLTKPQEMRVAIKNTFHKASILVLLNS